ncbi:rhodanese-like domain-containing protein [Falsibacillus albus]|uniref:Rhodanese-like domain-containing protein n=1 Tax=Falsibacillus albus TaxID=2478915 RepID=A0A3L7K0W3_9BACI|nr:rhodanese-like domain-containing protein [Falsibacillus albus]RLQ96713.1 rhodanese-like domain-containing protein [Falsibacillus albus]
MNWIQYVIIAIILIYFIRTIMPAKGIQHIDAATLKTQLKDRKKQFVDVRTPGEYNTRHIKEFRNIPLHELGGKASELKKDEEIVVICQSGMRSQKAAKLLKKKGFEKVTNVRGGMSAWR